MTNADNRPTVPQPFLGPLFEPGVEPIIATGFNYHAEEIALHGVKVHNAIDMDLPRGTKILAPADGYYIATYGEVLLRNRDGSPRMLSAKAARAVGQDINPPTSDGEWPVYFGSFVVQGWHGRGRYTQSAHVDWVNPAIPYYPPVEVKDEHGRPSGDRRHSPMLRATVAEYRRPGAAAFLKAGEVIAEVGMTGCGWNKPCYDFARFEANGRPDFRGVSYPYYTTPHLHFAVFGRRASRGRNAPAFDPFGIYGTFNDGYPASRADWSRAMPNAKHAPLWLS